MQSQPHQMLQEFQKYSEVVRRSTVFSRLGKLYHLFSFPLVYYEFKRVLYYILASERQILLGQILDLFRTTNVEVKDRFQLAKVGFQYRFGYLFIYFAFAIISFSEYRSEAFFRLPDQHSVVSADDWQNFRISQIRLHPRPFKQNL